MVVKGLRTGGSKVVCFRHRARIAASTKVKRMKKNAKHRRRTAGKTETRSPAPSGNGAGENIGGGTADSVGPGSIYGGPIYSVPCAVVGCVYSSPASLDPTATYEDIRKHIQTVHPENYGEFMAGSRDADADDERERAKHTEPGPPDS